MKINFCEDFSYYLFTNFVSLFDSEYLYIIWDAFYYEISIKPPEDFNTSIKFAIIICLINNLTKQIDIK